MKKLVLFVLVVLVLVGIILAIQNNNAEVNPAVNNIPEDFRNQNIPVYVCDKNPLENVDAACWELGK